MRRAAASAGAALREAGTFTSAASGCKGGVGIDARTIKREDGVTDSHNHRQPNFRMKFGWRWLRPRCVGPAGLLGMTDGWGKTGKAPTTAGAALREAGTFASAASGGRSEQKGVAAVKIL